MVSPNEGGLGLAGSRLLVGRSRSWGSSPEPQAQPACTHAVPRGFAACEQPRFFIFNKTVLKSCTLLWVALAIYPKLWEMAASARAFGRVRMSGK